MMRLMLAGLLLSSGCGDFDNGNGNGYVDNDHHNNSPEDNNDGDDNGEENSYPACAKAPSGTGYWEDEGKDGLHCNYLRDGTDDWAYTLNSSETDCLEASWAPNQNDGGSVRPWYKNGNRGCDWVIPW